MSVEYLATKADFDKCLADAGDKVVAIDFTATWCPPCKMIGPKFEAMVADYPNCVLKKVDVDANAETDPAELFGGSSPTETSTESDTVIDPNELFGNFDEH